MAERIKLGLILLISCLSFNVLGVNAQAPSPVSTTVSNAAVSGAACIKVGTPPGPIPSACATPDPASLTQQSPSQTTTDTTTGTTSTPSEGFTFYCQGNPAWGPTCGLGKAGCGPTSIAMILTYFNVSKTPPEVDQLFFSSNARGCSAAIGSTIPSALHSGWMKDLNFQIGPDIHLGGRDGILDIAQARKFLDSGYLILGSSEAFPCVNCSDNDPRRDGNTIDHIFVVDYADPSSGTIHVRDPNNCSYGNGNDEYQQNIEMNVTDFTWLYAYPMKRITPGNLENENF